MDHSLNHWYWIRFWSGTYYIYRSEKSRNHISWAIKKRKIQDLAFTKWPNLDQVHQWCSNGTNNNNNIWRKMTPRIVSTNAGIAQVSLRIHRWGIIASIFFPFRMGSAKRFRLQDRTRVHGRSVRFLMRLMRWSEAEESMTKWPRHEEDNWWISQIDLFQRITQSFSPSVHLDQRHHPKI